MLLDILITVFIIVTTVIIHTSGMMIVVRILRKHKASSLGFLRSPTFLIVEIVLVMFAVSIVEVLLWAITYMVVETIEGFEKAFYFSMVTFTTLGYGDIVLTGTWRLLASFEAAIGIIMFGWTTAIVFAAVQYIFFPKDSDS